MKKFQRSLEFIFFLFVLSLTGTTRASDFSGDILLGYSGGPGFQFNFIASNFARDFPLNLQVGVGHTSVNPGNAAAARKIFINDATNGDPEKSGVIWDLRLDFLYRVEWLSLRRGYLYGGPRYAMFSANFKFIGGNEFFEITSNQWGLGLGLIAFFQISNKLDFVTTTGFDYYFPSSLGGHDTVYSSDGEHINPRNDYTYEDADAALNNPTFLVRLLVGVNYHF